jgi:hypothetical protein
MQSKRPDRASYWSKPGTARDGDSRDPEARNCGSSLQGDENFEGSPPYTTCKQTGMSLFFNILLGNRNENQ